MKNRSSSYSTAKEAAISLSIPVLRKLHGAGQEVLKLTGYQWSTELVDGNRFGLWIKKSNKQRSKDSGKKLLFVPGFGDTPLSWFWVLKILEPSLLKHYTEICLLDYPGYNGFLHHETPINSMDTMMSATAQIFDRVSPHSIVGHSLGGWVTANHSLRGKNPATRVVLVSPSGAFNSEESKQAWRERFMKVVESQNFDDLRPHVFCKEPIWFRFVKPEFERFITHEATREFILSVNENHRMDPHIAAAKSDFWFVWGEKDTLVPIELLDGWLPHLPKKVAQKQVIRLKNVGHTPQMESILLTANSLKKALLS
jgi:pimeloyl-ACP methyl ester carboxylesterase